MKDRKAGRKAKDGLRVVHRNDQAAVRRWAAGSGQALLPMLELLENATAWYEGLRANNGGDASSFARYYRVPGISRCGVGPSTDQFDMLPALAESVEKGQAPTSVIAQARGAGNALGTNPDVPAGWSASRTRPLCPYPQVARLKPGATDLASAGSFRCE